MSNSHLINLSWHNNRPHLIFSPEEILELLPKQKFSWTLSNYKVCVGYYDIKLKQRFSCLTQKKLFTKNSTQCYLCRSKEMTYYTFTGYSSRENDAIEYLTNQQHQLYLNLFGNSYYKIGVASQSRLQARVLEQGAYASLYFAKANGFKIREIESFISKNLKIPDKVHISRKIKLLNQTNSEDQAQQQLNDQVIAIKQQIPAELSNLLHDQHLYFYNLPFYHLSNLETYSLPTSKAILEPAKTIHGEVKSVCGSLLIYADFSDELQVINLKELIGYYIK